MSLHEIFGMQIASPVPLLAPRGDERCGSIIEIVPFKGKLAPRKQREVRVYPRRKVLALSDHQGYQSYFSRGKITTDLNRLTDPRVQVMLFKNLVPHIANFTEAWLLHASAFAIEGQAVIVLGESGSGKSTLAFMSRAYGAVQLADDITLLERNGGEICVIPSGSGSLLLPEMAQSLSATPPLSSASIIDSHFEKKWIPELGNAPRRHFPLAGILFLERQPQLSDPTDYALRMLIKGAICTTRFGTTLAPRYLPLFGELLRKLPLDIKEPPRSIESTSELLETAKEMMSDRKRYTGENRT